MSGPAQFDELPLAEQVRQLKEQLTRMQMRSSLGELLSTTTHEFNNVLTTIINYAKLGMRHKDAPTREKAFDRILSASQRAAKITSGVLGMARNKSTKMEPTDLAALVEDSLLLLERELNKYHIVLEKYFHPVPPIRLSGGQIQQVLLNLLTNARQAMPHGGRVVIKNAHDTATNTVDLTIRDSGSGIPAENLPHIFEPFYSTKTGPDASGKGGTGLGLAHCREIVEAHQGRIRVESTVGRGTSFTLKFPLAAEPTSAQAPPPAAPATASPTPPITPTTQQT